MKKGNKNEAIDAFEKVLELKPNNKKAHRALKKLNSKE